MGISRTTNTIGISILDKGTLGWGSITNNNWDLADAAFAADRSRITALETTSAVLPVAIANRVGSNLLHNNTFIRSIPSDPAIAADWLSVFANGAVGNTTRDSSTFLTGLVSQRISIVNVNLGNQQRPFPGLNVLDPSTNAAIPSNDPRQLSNGFGYVFQAVSLLPYTNYTLSCYGKSEIPNPILSINVHWKIGVVFKDTNGAIIQSYFSQPQVNLTSAVTTNSFQRAQLSFVTPNLPVVLAEVWLVCEGATPGSIGSSFFDGAQLEQAAAATSLETFSVVNGSFFIEGDLNVGGSLILQQDQLVLATNKVIFDGNVQIGSDVTQNVLDVFTKIATFYGPVVMENNLTVGGDANPDGYQVKITAYQTTFFNNQSSLTPEGGNVTIQGDLVVGGNTTLGNNPTQDVVTVNATIALQSIDAVGDGNIAGSLVVGRAVSLGTNQAVDGLKVNMEGQGSDFYGDVRMHDTIEVYGNTTIGTNVGNTLEVTGTTILNGPLNMSGSLTVGGPVTFNIGSSLSDNFNATANNITFSTVGHTNWSAQDFTLTGSFQAGTGSAGQYFNALVGNLTLGYPSTANTNTLSVNAITSTFTGSAAVSKNLSVGGDINVSGNSPNSSFLFGSSVAPSSSFVSFQAQSITNYLSHSAAGGTISLGDPNGLIHDAYSRLAYDMQLYVNAGTTYFGSAGSGGGGDEVVGDVIVGGNITVGGKTTLGNSLAGDDILITTREININVGTGNINIGGQYQGHTYDPNGTDHGGITIDTNGNLSMDGKLTVKGPIDPSCINIVPSALDTNQYAISVVNNLVDTFLLTNAGAATLASSLGVGNGNIANFTSTSSTFGTSGAPLTTFQVYSSDGYFSNNLEVTSTLTVNNITVNNNIATTGSLNVGTNLQVSNNVTALGTLFTFGQLTPTTHFNVLAQLSTFGDYPNSIGNVQIANTLTVKHNMFIGQSDADVTTITGGTISIAPGSHRISIGPDFLELAGFRVGGGFQNNIYNSNDLDHGGVTIDAYGNIFADGVITSNAALGFRQIQLNAPPGTATCQPFLYGINAVTGDEVYLMDNLGNVEQDGYLRIHDRYVLGQHPDGYTTCNQPVSQTSASAYAMLQVIHNPSDTTFEVDNHGNVVADGYLTTYVPGGSNLSTVSVTVGDGITTIGDFNLSGFHNNSSDPITVALQYISSLPGAPGGKIFIKRGTYSIPSGGYLIPTNVSIEGEGNATHLQGSGSTTFGIKCNGSFSKVSNLLLTNCITGIVVASGFTDTSIQGVEIQSCIVGVELDSSSARCRFVGNSLFGIAATSTIGINGTAGGDNCTFEFNYIQDFPTGMSIAGLNNSVANNIIQGPTLGAITGFNISGSQTVLGHNNITKYPTGATITGTATGTRFHDNMFDGTAGAGTVGAAIAGPYTFLAKNYFKDFAEGVTISATTCKVEGNNFSAGTAAGTTSTDGIHVSAGGNYAKIVNNSIDGFDSTGVALASGPTDVTVTHNTILNTAQNITAGITLGGNTNIVVSGNQLHNVDQGIVITGGSSNNVSNNVIVGVNLTGNSAIAIGGTDQTVSNNVIQAFAGSTVISLTGTYCRVIGNDISNGSTAISVAAGQNIVAENTIRGQTSTGINVSATGTNSGCIISANWIDGGTVATTGINVALSECAINNNYVVNHTTNGIVISGNDCIAVGNVTLRNPT